MSNLNSKFLNEFNSATKPLILDGSLGTSLPQEAQEHALWSTYSVINDPDTIKNIHMGYLANGSQIIQTSTYQTSEETLKQFYPELDYQQTILKSIDIASDAISAHRLRAAETKEDIGNSKFICGSVGPYGASLANGAEYTGDYGAEMTRDKLVAFHQKRLQVLCQDPRMDIIGFETIPSMLELQCISAMMMEQYPTKPYYVSLSVNGEALADGSTFDQIKEWLETATAAADNFVALGVNCLGLFDSLKWLAKLSTIITNKQKLIVYPNSGEKYDGKLRKFVNNPDEMSWSEYLDLLKGKEWWSKVGVIGGCCRTDCGTIKTIKESLA